MNTLVRVSLLLSIAILSGQAQFCKKKVKEDSKYTNCDHTTAVCECKDNKVVNNVCRFCIEIEQQHTFTKYFLDNEEDIPGYGGDVWSIDDNGDLTPLPPEPNTTPGPCGSLDSPPERCTDAHTADGKSFRPIITVNNRFPAPTLIVPEKVIVLVDVYNKLSSESTSIHWHGMHQMNTPWMDGVEHITQCGIAPSSSFRYIFRANPPGTHWYHSHSGAQRTDGLFGALIVREASVPPELEPDYSNPHGEHTLTLIDWQKENSLDLFAQIHAGIRYFDQDGVPPRPIPTPTSIPTPISTPTPDTDPRVPRTCSPDGVEVGPVSYWSGLINGLGKHPEVDYRSSLLSTFTVEPNKRYRFRLIGAQSLFAYRFSIDEHELVLIATDGHFVTPTPVDFIIIHSGERYDFILRTKNIAEGTSLQEANFIIRAETLETQQSLTNREACNQQDELYPLVSNHRAEAILHYSTGSDIPKGMDYETIADNSIAKSTECIQQSTKCKAINCPFEQFPSRYNIDCMHLHELNLLNPVTDDSQLPDFNTMKTFFFNFGFEGDGNTSAINGRNFVFPQAPLQLMQRNDKIPNGCKLSITTCDKITRLVTPDCRCTHVRNINYGESYRFVFTATGTNRNNRFFWNFAHPIHLHGHSFHVARVGFGSYNDNGRLTRATEDISCIGNGDGTRCTDPVWSIGRVNTDRSNLKQAPLKDTILIPAGGYAVVYFKANNPGYWFLHCHIEVHQLEGMAVVINEAKDRHNLPPSNMPQCGAFTWQLDDFIQKESNPSSSRPITREEQFKIATFTLVGVCIVCCAICYCTGCAAGFCCYYEFKGREDLLSLIKAEQELSALRAKDDKDDKEAKEDEKKIEVLEQSI